MSNSVLVTRQWTEEAEQDSYSDFEDLCKEVQCIEVVEQKTSANKESNPLLSVNHQKHASQGASFNTDNNLVKLCPNEVSALSLVKEEEIQNVRTNGTDTIRVYSDESYRSLALRKSRSCRATMMVPSQCVKDYHARPQGIHQKHIALGSNPEQKASNDVFKKPNKKCVSEDNITSICEFVTELKEIAQVQYQKTTTDSQVR